MTAYEDWLSKFEGALSRCPWPGPSSVVDPALDYLVCGRDELAREALTKTRLDETRLVIVSGDSGVGKSTFLNAKLLPLLEKHYDVAVCDGYGVDAALRDDGHSATTGHFLAAAIFKTREERGRAYPKKNVEELRNQGTGTLRDALEADSESEHEIVIVLDQFEELIRYSDIRFIDVMNWVARTVASDSRVRVLLSLRSEYVHRLKPLLDLLRNDVCQIVDVPAIRDRAVIREIVTSANKNGQRAIDAERDGAADRLTDLWMQHSRRPGLFFQLGLLHLQATLFVLYLYAQEAAGEGKQPIVRVMDIERFEKEWARAKEMVVGVPGGADNDAHRLREDEDWNTFAFGFRESVRRKLSMCEEACDAAGVDPYLKVGARSFLARTAQHLSSGGYKVPLEAWDLTVRALSREFAVLGLGHDQATGGLRDLHRVFRFLLHSKSPLNRESSVENTSARHDDQDQPDLDPENLSAGPMMGHSPGSVGLEELRRAAFALRWLDAAELARLTTAPDDTMWVSLNHDGIGVALNAWATTHGAGPDEALCRLTAARGEHYVWDREAIGPTGERDFRVVANLNWRDCRVTATFRRVVFVNCDFSGSRFENCEFEGATFVNCVLDDANFEDCEIRGAVDIEHAALEREEGAQATHIAPSFTVRAEPREASFFGAYGEHGSVNLPAFFSDIPGKPARIGVPKPGFLGDWIAHFDTRSRPVGSGDASSRDEVDRAVEAAQAASEKRQEDVKLPYISSPATGGLAIVGGKVCFLTIYRCSSKSEGSIALHHVSGDGLDVVEPTGIRVVLFESALRGICISRDPRLGHSDESLCPMDLEVANSLVVSVYLAGGFRGSATFTGSRVLSLINASRWSRDPSMDLCIDIDDSPYTFLVNAGQAPIAALDLSGERPGFTRDRGSVFSVDDLGALANDLERMDYRRHPDVWERDQRIRRKSRDSVDDPSSAPNPER